MSRQVHSGRGLYIAVLLVPFVLALPTLELIFGRDDGLPSAINNLKGSLKALCAAECPKVSVVRVLQIDGIVFDEEEESLPVSIGRRAKEFSLPLARGFSGALTAAIHRMGDLDVDAF